MGGMQLEMKAVKNGGSWHAYPSVDCGVISRERAVQEIGWSPLPLVWIVDICRRKLLGRLFGCSKIGGIRTKCSMSLWRRNTRNGIRGSKKPHLIFTSCPMLHIKYYPKLHKYSLSQ